MIRCFFGFEWFMIIVYMLLDWERKRMLLSNSKGDGCCMYVGTKKE